jgi:hypothetical protein
MKKIILSLNVVSILLLIGSCTESKSEDEQLRDQTELLSSLFNTDNLPQQDFQIEPNRDTTLIGENGTVLRIYKNSFVDENGNEINAPIKIELKEALNPIDIVNANLTTTSNGKLLQTGGMIYLDAKCGNKSLRIAENCSIGVIVPNEKIESDMKIFKGEKTNDGINWIEPKSTLNEEVQELEKLKEKPKKVKSINEIEAIFDFVDSDTTGKHQAQVDEAVAIGVPDFGQFTAELTEKGQNYFLVDYSTSYIFELKSLGWANIDRLYSDPRTQLVELDTKITNSKDFDRIYITMVISKMYLPGYQKKDGGFSFTHGDNEKPQLPVGEKAMIFATAYKGNVPHFDLITTSIKKKETLTLNLKETTKEELKTTLKNKL